MAKSVAKKAKKVETAKKAVAKRPTKKASPAKASKAPAAAKTEASSPSPRPALKPLTLKQKLSLIRLDPVTGKCQHGMAPETCSFCMQI